MTPTANPEKTYTFHVPTPNGTAVLHIPHRAMKVCPCGSEFFRTVSRVTYVKPKGMVGAEPIAMRVEVYVCDKCDRELLPDDASIGDAKTLIVPALEGAPAEAVSEQNPP